MQRKQVNDAVTLLKSPQRFLVMDDQAGCKPVTVQVETPLIETSEAGHEGQHEEHAHEHSHDVHEHEGEAHSHADFQAHYHYRCKDPDSLSSLEIDLFSHFPLIEVIHAQIITQSSQQEMEFTAEKTRIPL
jgi:ABC-type Zn2+ transport system substrate-binding protein/surface adhesin